MRKKPNKLALLVFIPIAVGIGLIIGGSVGDSYAMRMAGVYVLFGGSFAMAVIMTIVIIAGGLRPDKSADKSKPDGNASPPVVAPPDKTRDAAAEEAERIADINTSYGYDNKIKEAEHQISHIKRAYKHSSGGDKVKSFLLLGFLLTDFFMIIVFAALRIFVGSIVCFVLFGGTIIVLFIVVKIKEHISVSTNFDRKAYERKLATVVTCVMSSSTSAGGRSSRISSITYRVQLDIDGNTYNAYSRTFYADGETIEVWLKKNGSTVKIIEPDDDLALDNDEYSTERMAAQTEDIARACDLYRGELTRALDACADDRERSELLFRARRELSDDVGADAQTDAEEYYANKLYLKKSEVISELMSELKSSPHKTATANKNAVESAESDPEPEERYEAAQSSEPEPEPEPAPPLAAAPSTERAEGSDEPPSTHDGHSSARPKRTTIEYKGIKKK